MTKKNVSKDLEVIQKGAPSLIIDNTVTVDKKELIDLMILEKEEILEKQLKEANVELEEVEKASVDAFIQDLLKKEINEMKEKHIKCFEILGAKQENVEFRIDTGYHQGIKVRSMLKDGKNISGDYVPEIRIWISYSKPLQVKIEKYNDEVYKKKRELGARICSLEKEIKELPKQARKLRAALLKKALLQDEEGRKILEYFERVASSIKIES